MTSDDLLCGALTVRPSNAAVLAADDDDTRLTVCPPPSLSAPRVACQGLRRAISPGVGQVVGFDGHALHGGEPIVRGTRYIIAAFLFLEHEPPASLGGAMPRLGKHGREAEEASGAVVDTSSQPFAFNFG